MRLLLKYAIIPILMPLVLSCSSDGDEKNQEPSSDMTKYKHPGTTYEIFVQSFADSDGDGIGDISGMASKLEYLEELGVKAVWLMPIMPSPSYHKYDVTDYRDIHPDYGTLDQFKDFVSAAHKKNIKVIIDLVINHSSAEHPWFKSAASDVNSPYRDYYVWADKDSIADQIAKKEVSFDSDNITQWHAPNGDTTALHYYGFFYGGMPDLNFDNPKLRAEIYDIGRFWLEEVKVDGFRLDAAKHIFPDDRQEDNVAFWKEFLEEMKKYNPNVYTVGEVWANSETVVKFSPGFRNLFNFDLAFSILESVDKGMNYSATIDGPSWVIDKQNSWVNKLIETRSYFQSKNPEFTDAIFLSNHDQNRYMSFLKGNLSKTKLASAILLTLPGQPYIYYGEEIGMLGKKPDENIREPFLWTSGSEDFDRTKWMPAKYSTDSTVKPVDMQKSKKGSLWNHYKDLIAIRNQHPAFDYGEIRELPQNKESIVAYAIYDSTSEYHVYHNLDSLQNSIPQNEHELIFSRSKELKKTSESFEIPARGSLIFKKK